MKQAILDALAAKPAQKADEIARKLGVERTAVNKLLYGPLKGQVVQDKSYRWSLSPAAARAGVAGKPGAAAKADSAEAPTSGFADTDLGRLCRYYLSCLGHDAEGVSVWQTSKHGDHDYAELETLPRSASALEGSEQARKLLGRKRTERGRYGLSLGYPVYIRHIRGRDGTTYAKVEPLLLCPVEREDGRGPLRIDFTYPQINQQPFRAFTNADRDMVLTELVQLEEELGLGSETDPPPLDEVAMRLEAVRPEWPWTEEVDPDRLSPAGGPLDTLPAEGIYNRAVLVLAEKSPYTQGLEQELRDLGKLPEAAYANTALGRWLARKPATDDPGQTGRRSLIEVLPMNAEQRDAVHAALSRPHTVITGPPGTGKSQVVTNILTNAAWQGKRVLFASKNNKAVDVVEQRINALGSRPILLRVGAAALQAKLAEFVLALMSATVSASERADYEQAADAMARAMADQAVLAAQADALVRLRNEVDQLERDCEDARRLLGPEVFARAPDLDLSTLRTHAERLGRACSLGDRERAGALTRLIWPLLRKARLAAVGAALTDCVDHVRSLGLRLPPAPMSDHELAPVWQTLEDLTARIEAAARASTYLTKLAALQAHRPLEDIARAEVEVLDRVVSGSSSLWKLWLRLQPSKLTVEDRRNLGQYEAVLRMMVEAKDADGPSTGVRSKYNEILKKVSPHMPLWAVTSLSARGRIPFEPGVFDLVIFDEASQCDIASALPLLYRAKAVAVIGDPMQLSHITALPRGQDQKLLEQNGLLQTLPEWSYSHQSLYGLAASRVAGEDIVTLLDHHRSHADIIGFSNAEFYEGKLRVATRYTALKRPAPREPGIRWIDVKGKAAKPGNRSGAVNHAEVDAVIEILRDLVLVKGYQGTVGAVTPFHAQAVALREAASRDDRLQAALNARQWLSETAHKFQGDERDVMIFSPVVAPGIPQGSLHFLRSQPNLFNVAITRARAQMIVAGDLRACAACDVGYLSRFAAHSQTLDGESRQDIEVAIQELGPRYPKVARPELVSDWEHVLYEALFAAGMRPIPQYPVEKYILDFLLIHGDRRLAIEVDGERYHRNWTGELCRRDQIRDQRLLELGHDVMRFWVYEVRDDLDGCVARIRSWLERA